MKIAIISDIHEDIISLQKALNIIEKEQCEQIICLGDIIGCSSKHCEYNLTKDANECINLIIKNNIKTIIGNHDLLHIKKTPIFNAGFNYSKNWYELELFEREKLSINKTWIYYSEAHTNLNTTSIEFLNNQKEYFIENYKELNILFSHNYYPDFSGSLFNTHFTPNQLKEHFLFMENNNCLLSFCGHRHIQGVLSSGKTKSNKFSALFHKFTYYRFGLEKVKNQLQFLTLPAIANQNQLNGFVIFDTSNFDINIICLKTNKPIFYERNRL